MKLSYTERYDALDEHTHKNTLVAARDRLVHFTNNIPVCSPNLWY